MSIESEITSKFNWSKAQYEKRLLLMEAQLFREYNKSYIKIRTQINNLFEKMGSTPSLNHAMQYNRLNNIHVQIIGEMAELNKNGLRMTEGYIKNEFANKYYEVGFGLEVPLQTNLRFGLLNAETIAASVVNPYDLIKWQSRFAGANVDLAQRIVQSNITDGLIRGQSYQQITRELKKTIGKSFSNDMMRIVRTEGARANSWGGLTGIEQAQSYAKEAGMKMAKLWISTLDDKTRDMHADMDQREEDETGGFTLPDGNWTQAPALSGLPEHDIHCRCTTGVSVDGVKSQTRFDNIEKKNVPYTSYNEYFQNKIKKTKAPIKKPAELKTKVS